MRMRVYANGSYGLRGWTGGDPRTAGRLLERDEPSLRSLACLKGPLTLEGSVPVNVREIRRLPCRLL